MNCFCRINFMDKQFFTSKQAAEMTGCTLRQLQYWREKEVVVPIINGTGTGRSVYYSRSEVMELAVMEYCLKVGLNFEAAAATVKRLKDEGLILTSDEKAPRRFMLCWDGIKGKLMFMEFELKKAIALLEKGKAIIPVWLDEIYQGLSLKV